MSTNFWVLLYLSFTKQCWPPFCLVIEKKVFLRNVEETLSGFLLWKDNVFEPKLDHVLENMRKILLKIAIEIVHFTASSFTLQKFENLNSYWNFLYLMNPHFFVTKNFERILKYFSSIVTMAPVKGKHCFVMPDSKIQCVKSIFLNKYLDSFLNPNKGWFCRIFVGKSNNSFLRNYWLKTL